MASQGRKTLTITLDSELHRDAKGDAVRRGEAWDAYIAEAVKLRLAQPVRKSA